MDKSNEKPDELDRQEEEARQLDQSTIEQGDHSSFRPFEVERGLGGEIIRHKPEDRGEDLSDVDNRVEYYDDEGNLIGFGDAEEQPTEDEVDFIDIEDIEGEE